MARFQWTSWSVSLVEFPRTFSSTTSGSDWKILTFGAFEDWMGSVGVNFLALSCLTFEDFSISSFYWRALLKGVVRILEVRASMSWSKESL